MYNRNVVVPALFSVASSAGTVSDVVAGVAADVEALALSKRSGHQNSFDLRSEGRLLSMVMSDQGANQARITWLRQIQISPFLLRFHDKTDPSGESLGDMEASFYRQYAKTLQGVAKAFCIGAVVFMFCIGLPSDIYLFFREKLPLSNFCILVSLRILFAFGMLNFIKKYVQTNRYLEEERGPVSCCLCSTDKAFRTSTRNHANDIFHFLFANR